ncbi:hypothetical protein [Cellulomonas persica]|uniref:Uncharacterized protein n=1 Tax=Cellulomonas persica TaxID=76861 RepID=A0A510UUU3_9CELL|nr:hypothetical protein [Cellulomonas persica]GEK18432.1 hypothetical protein CPE01_21650 [Cellulomonas persica]
MTPGGDHKVRSLRLDRRALRAEKARVVWWRRLVRARIDLAVASAARPDPLGEDVAFQLPLDISLAVPHMDELMHLLPEPAPADVAELDRLRALDDRLASYEQGVTAALARTTDSLISHLADDPTGAGDLLAGPPARR